MANTMHDRLERLQQSIDNHFEHETDQEVLFALDICRDLLFNVDYSQSSALLLGKHLRQAHKTIARHARNPHIPASVSSTFEGVRFSLARVVPLKQEEIERDLNVWKEDGIDMAILPPKLSYWGRKIVREAALFGVAGVEGSYLIERVKGTAPDEVYREMIGELVKMGYLKENRTKGIYTVVQGKVPQ